MTADHQIPLRFLEYKGFIIWNRVGVDSDMLKIKVTGAGAEEAIRLHTWYGRVGVWYRDHKDGVIGLMTAALVAIVTTLATNWIQHKEEPPAVQCPQPSKT